MFTLLDSWLLFSILTQHVELCETLNNLLQRKAQKQQAIETVYAYANSINQTN